MSEVAEIHVDEHDSYGKKIGLLAAIIAVLLSIFTISAHRAHTETIELQNEVNDQWAHYQGKRIRAYQLEMNMDLLNVMTSTITNKANLIKKYSEQHQKYNEELETIKSEAQHMAEKNMNVQKKALYYDFAEGILEISLIMTSLYFISRKKFFPNIGFFFGCVGAFMGLYGLFL